MDAAHEAGKHLVSPRDLALTYDRVVSAHWRGETEVATAVGSWFEAHWSEQAPPEPEDPPEGTSILGGAGAGIRWYRYDEAVLGYVSQRDDGCYRVPTNEAVPSLVDSWDVLELEATRQPHADHLLRQTRASSVTTESTRSERHPAAQHWSTRDPVPDKRDARVLPEPGAPDHHAGESDDVTSQEPVRTEVLVAVHVLDETMSH